MTGNKIIKNFSKRVVFHGKIIIVTETPFDFWFYEHYYFNKKREKSTIETILFSTNILKYLIL
jgi:hypothetical protein